MQEHHSDCTRVAQHALVLGPSGHAKPDPSVPPQPAQLANTALQSDSSQESAKPKSACLAPRTSVIKEHWNQPDQSMRQSGPFLKSGASVIR